MPVPPRRRRRDVEQGYPENEGNFNNDDSRNPLLSAGFSGNSGNARNPEQFRHEPLGTDDPQPSSSTAQDEIITDPELQSTREYVGRLIKEGARLAFSDDDWDYRNLLPEEEKIRDVLEDLVQKIGPNVKDGEGNTVLRSAIDADWLPGVCVALDAGADVTIQAQDGNTSLHAAVSDVLCDDRMQKLRETIISKILSVARNIDAVNCLSKSGETALFNAVRSGQNWCVTHLLNEGYNISLKHTVNNTLVSVFHIAAKNGHKDILTTLLEFDEDTTKSMIDKQTDPTEGGFAPIHYAVEHNQLECVETLLYYKANVNLKTNSINECKTPLEIAIEKDFYEIADYILFDISDNNLQHSVLKQANDKGWLPLHLAIHKGSESFIKLLLNYDPSLVLKTKTENPETALSMIIQHVTNPTKFLKSIFDSYISLDSSDKVIVDYKILMPSKKSEDEDGAEKEEQEMEVIDELLKTGNKFDQKRLLLHPLIESFIYLKWTAVMPFYFIITTIYLMFMILLAVFALSVFDNIDNKTKPECFKLFFGVTAIFIFIAFNITHEVLMNSQGSRYFCKIENYIKLSSLALATIFSLVILVQGWEEGARHMATGALLLTSFQMVNILSQCPNWGLYVVMFQKVAWNVAKILIIFGILIIGFAFSFKIQLRSRQQFDGWWHAIVRTLVLLASEFNYDDFFQSQNTTNYSSTQANHTMPLPKHEPFSDEVFRIIFAVFLILIAIVLMNVMTGIAVDDINDLKAHGSIGRLEKQATFLRSIEKMKYKCMKVILPERSQFPDKIDVEKDTVNIFIYRNVRELPKRFKDAFFSIAEINNYRQCIQNNEFIESEVKEERAADQENFFAQTKEALDALKITTADNASQIKDLNSKLEDITSRSSEMMQLLRSFKEYQDKKAGI